MSEASEITLEYDFCDSVLGKIRGLNSEEKKQMYLWLQKQLDAIGMRQPLAIMNPQELIYRILDRGVFQGDWENMNKAKKFASELLGYVRRYKEVPKVVVRVNIPEAKFPPEIQIARMKSQSYSDEDILKKAKALGLEETKAREIVKDYISIQSRFDLKTFCDKLKKEINL